MVSLRCINDITLQPLLHVDIDECLSNDTNNCNQLCANTVGSYLCYCHKGFQLALDSVTCVGKAGYMFCAGIGPWLWFHSIYTDTNECGSSNGGCDQVCTNTVGSYYCQCDKGYSLNADIHTCDGMYV